MDNKNKKYNKINFELVNDFMCITPCIKKKYYYVGSINCQYYCDNFIDIDNKKNIVKCRKYGIGN